MKRVLVVLGGLVALVCGVMVLVALVMTVTEGPAATATDTPGAMDARITEAFADVATAGPGTPTRTPLPTTDPTQMWLEVTEGWANETATAAAGS